MVLLEKGNRWEEEVTKEDKIIKKVLHRLLSEECTKINNSLERIGALNHQAENFSKMFSSIQEEVKNEMFKLMHENGWDDWSKELKEELRELKKSENKKPNGEENANSEMV